MVAAVARVNARSDPEALATAATVALVRVVELEAFVQALAHEV
jgi:hypothetical protein